jgi:hypothetical protein
VLGKKIINSLGKHEGSGVNSKEMRVKLKVTKA